MLHMLPNRMQNIRDYLVQEAIDKQIPEGNKAFAKDFRLDADSMPAYHPPLPRQHNGTDCGLFLLEYVESFLTNPECLTADL